MGKSDTKAFAKKVKAREKRFQEMSATKKRVTVAKDVIEALEDKRLKAKSGVYLQLAKKVKKVAGDTEIQEILIEQPKCTACALGSMFVCSVLRNDNLRVNHFNDALEYIETDDAVGKSSFNEEEGIYAGLAYLFTREQLELIESAFERKRMTSQSTEFMKPADVTILWRAICFGKQFPSSRKRMMAIMTNIIKHEGVFTPPDTDQEQPDSAYSEKWGSWGF